MRDTVGFENGSFIQGVRKLLGVGDLVVKGRKFADVADVFAFLLYLLLHSIYMATT